MNSISTYDYALSVTSQFYFCSLPLRLDSYSACLYGCEYCFASTRGGYRGEKGLQEADPKSLERRLARVCSDGPRSLVDEFLAERQPIHFGGMADAFPQLERTRGVSKALLETVATHDYPTVISTKSDLLLDPAYLEILQSGRFIVQVSISTLDNDLARRIEIGVPSPSARLDLLAALSAMGIPTACRFQPVLPTRADDVLAAVEQCGREGVRHFAVEHLKLPLEKSARIDRLGQALGIDLRAFFRERRAVRVGREWVLPLKERQDVIVGARDAVHSFGMTFGAADNDVLHLSDGDACCAGVDRIWPEANVFRHNYLGAVRARDDDGLIRRASLESYWCPDGSAANVVNSRSRLPVANGRSPGMKAYLDQNWNGRANGSSPRAFAGVHESGEVDDNGFLIYRFDEATPLE